MRDSQYLYDWEGNRLLAFAAMKVGQFAVCVDAFRAVLVKKPQDTIAVRNLENCEKALGLKRKFFDRNLVFLLHGFVLQFVFPCRVCCFLSSCAAGENWPVPRSTLLHNIQAAKYLEREDELQRDESRRYARETQEKMLRQGLPAPYLPLSSFGYEASERIREQTSTLSPIFLVVIYIFAVCGFFAILNTCRGKLGNKQRSE